ncbi:MAG: respiratory nitrate reductase subunit beta [Gammaproteobacteria bacterium]|nr:respiratory nitrate reductase subunit beta [Gammaproteobacteria bacterium]
MAMKDDDRRGTKQLAMVMNLDKCLGCHTCTIACKNLWTNKNGREYMYWNNVETRPGVGYPKDWENMPRGTPSGGKNSTPDMLPQNSDYGVGAKGEIMDYDYEAGLFNGDGVVQPDPEPAWLPNWDEDQGDGSFPNSYYFYLPRICNHCTKPACLEACPRQAIYKREEDGIVLADQDRCRGYRLCVQACPYKKMFFNAATQKSEKCIFCYPRIEQGVAPACAVQCPGRMRHVGFLEDANSQVRKLAVEYQVALPLHPEYGTEPNVYYVPPFSGSSQVDAEGRTLNVDRIPMDYLRFLFGDLVDYAVQTLRNERDNVQAGGESEILEILNSNDRYEIGGGS